MQQQSCQTSRQQTINPVLLHHRQAKDKKSRINRCCVHPPPHTTILLFLLLFITSYNHHNHPQQQQQSTFFLFIQAQQITNNDVDNPRNRFCGITYQEAHQFCHLPPTQSLPCPSGLNDDCPYKLTCFTIQETCTQPPSTSPTLEPTHSPITRRSDDPTDHYFCGIGYDNLFGCSFPCPTGDSAECPTGQICYFDTPCDKRMQGNPNGNGGVPTGAPSSSGMSDLEGARNFCGRSLNEAMETCNRELHCPSGLNGEWCAGADTLTIAER